MFIFTYSYKHIHTPTHIFTNSYSHMHSHILIFIFSKRSRNRNKKNITNIVTEGILSSCQSQRVKTKSICVYYLKGRIFFQKNPAININYKISYLYS